MEALNGSSVLPTFCEAYSNFIFVYCCITWTFSQIQLQKLRSPASPQITLLPHMRGKSRSAACSPQLSSAQLSSNLSALATPPRVKHATHQSHPRPPKDNIFIGTCIFYVLSIYFIFFRLRYSCWIFVWGFLGFSSAVPSGLSGGRVEGEEKSSQPSFSGGDHSFAVSMPAISLTLYAHRLHDLFEKLSTCVEKDTCSKL